MKFTLNLFIQNETLKKKNARSIRIVIVDILSPLLV